jgi:hypothetical protein
MQFVFLKPVLAAFPFFLGEALCVFGILRFWFYRCAPHCILLQNRVVCRIRITPF